MISNAPAGENGGDGGGKLGLSLPWQNNLFDVSLDHFPMKRIILCLTAIALSGCGIVTPMVRQESKLSRLEVGLDRKNAINRMGSPDLTRTREIDGKVVQIDEYRLFKPGTGLFNALAGPIFLTATWWTPWLGDKFYDSYAVQYVDGKVHQWGRSEERQPELVADLTVKNR